MSASSSPSLSKRTRVLITIFGIAFIAALMLVVLGKISRTSARPVVVASVAAAHTTTAPLPTKLPMRRVLAFGDSLTAGTSGMELFPYAPHLERAIQRENTAVRHRGMPGWTTQSMLDDLDGERTGLRTAVKAGHPDVVIILAGSNDLGFGFTEEKITKNLLQLHSTCYENGVARTVAVAIPPSGYQSQVASAAALANAVNRNLKAFADSESRATYVPFPFDFEQGGENWFMDTLHFSETGYRVLGESLAPVVDQILKSMDEQETKRSS